MRNGIAIDAAREFAKFLETWCGGHGDEMIPRVHSPLSFLWETRSGTFKPSHKYPVTWSITIGSIVWPVLVCPDVYGTLVVVENIGDRHETTDKVWHLDSTDLVYDYGEYRFIRFKTPNMSKSYTRAGVYHLPSKRVNDEFAGILIAGFFVHKEKFYNTGSRTNGLSKSGKQIAQTVEVASSRGKKWEVMIYTDGTASCNCPSWIYQAHPLGKECKHTTNVLNQIKGTP